MKNIFLILSTLLIFISCNSHKEEKQNVQTMDPNDIQISEVVHDSLTTDQINKITKIQSVFAEVVPVSLEETITNFKRDQNPDSEIAIWIQMADAYEKYLSSKGNQLDLESKKEVFKLILSRSMMPAEEAIANSKLKILTEKEAKEVFRYYSGTPDPLEVAKKP